MECEFEGVVWEWRGPAPYHFVTVPPECAAVVRQVALAVTYGWGMVPVEVRLGRSRWRTSLFPKEGGYVLPLRDSARKKEEIVLGPAVRGRAEVQLGPQPQHLVGREPGDVSTRTGRGQGGHPTRTPAAPPLVDRLRRHPQPGRNPRRRHIHGEHPRGPHPYLLPLGPSRSGQATTIGVPHTPGIDRRRPNVHNG
jgi:hypothetical protein